MSTAATALLALCVALAWLAAAALPRLRGARARLHCIAFVNATAGPLAAAAVIVHDGLSTRSAKAVIIAVLSLAVGAVLTHATARALHRRASPGASSGKA